MITAPGDNIQSGILIATQEVGGPVTIIASDSYIYIPDVLRADMTEGVINTFRDLGWFFDPVKDGIMFKFNYDSRADIGTWDPWGQRDAEIENLQEQIDELHDIIDNLPLP